MRAWLPFVADWVHAARGVLRRMSPWFRGARERPTLGPEGVDQTPEVPHSTHHRRLSLPAPPPAGVVDFDVHGILGVRVRDARHDDLAAVSRELGSAVTAGTLAPDIVVCFVDELPATGIEHLEDGTPYRDGGVYHLAPDGEPLAHMRLGETLGGALIVCRRGLGHVPFLCEAIDLAALSHEWIPLHASGWVARGMGVLAAGRGGSGRTGALLAACQNGATPVAAEHVLVALDGHAMVGLDRAMTLREWQVAQLELPGAGVGPARRALAKAATLLDGLAPQRRASPPGARGTLAESAGRAVERARRRLDVNVSLDRLGRASDARPDLLILLETHDREEIAAERLDPDAATERLSMCLQAELMPALQGHLALQSAFAGKERTGVRRVPKLATRLLREATRWKPCYLVRHPKECTLEQLHGVIENLLPLAPAFPLDATDRGNGSGRHGPPAGARAG